MVTFTCVPDASARVPDAPRTRPMSGEKGCGSYESFAATLSQSFRLHRGRILHIQKHPLRVPDVSCTGSRCLRMLPLS